MPCKSRIGECTNTAGTKKQVWQREVSVSHAWESHLRRQLVDSLTCPSDDKFSALALRDIF